MIKNRNIATDAAIDVSKIAGSGLLGRGKVFYAAKANTDWASYYQPIIDKDYFYNSSTSVQSAVYDTVSGRADVVVVGPGKMQESVILGSSTAGSNKANLKIVAACHGWETQCRPSDASSPNGAYTPTGGTATNGFAFLILSRGVEISGFLCDGGGGYSGVYCGDGYNAISSSWNENTASAWIHDMTFRGGNEGVHGVVLDGCSADVKVEDCTFEQSTAAQIYITPGGGRTVQRPIIRRNVFIADNASYGVDMYNSATTIGVQVLDNYFADVASHAFTYAVRFQGAGVHSTQGNHFACTNKISASATDFCSGDFFHSAGNAPHFVQDSTDST